MCNNNCKICNRIIISDSVSVVSVAGVATLVIDLPATTAGGAEPYLNRCKYCIVVAQTVPDAATIRMPVAFSIGGVTTTVYPFLNCNGTQVTACAISARTRYPAVVLTDVTGGVFRSIRNLNCYNTDAPKSLPVTEAIAGGEG